MSNPSVLRSTSAMKSGAGSSPQSVKEEPEQPYQTKRGCLIMLAVFGGLIAVAVGAMLVTGMLNAK